jgi:hypothetical protein
LPIQDANLLTNSVCVDDSPMAVRYSGAMSLHNSTKESLVCKSS